MESKTKTPILPDDIPADWTTRRWLELALIFAIFFVVGGAPAPNINEAHYLCKAKHYWQPDWCAGDMFLESADAHLAFYWTIGWLANWFSLSTVAWIGRVAAWALLACGWQRLSRTILRGPASAAISAAAFLFVLSEAHLAGEWVVGGVEGKCFAYGLVFYGLAAMVEGRWRWVWPCFGLASSMHVLVGGWAVFLAGVVWLKESPAARTPLRSMLPALVLGGALALPGMVPALQLTRGVAAADRAEANQIYVFQRISHHLAPLSWSWDQPRVRKLVFSHLLLVELFFLLWMRLRRRMRMDSAVKDETSDRLARLMRFAWASLGLSVVALTWELITWNRPDWAASLLKYYWFRPADVAVPIAFCLTVGCLLERSIAKKTKWAILALLIAVALPSWHLLNISRARWIDPTPPADSKMRDAVAWQEACRWVRENTPEDSLFLVPRNSSTFNWNAQRRDVVTWKDVPQDATSLLVWRDRYFDVALRLDENGQKVLRRQLAEQGIRRVVHLSEKYGVDYVLTSASPPLQLPVVYRNRGYAVYEMSRGKRKLPSKTGR